MFFDYVIYCWLQLWFAPHRAVHSSAGVDRIGREHLTNGNAVLN